MTIIFGCPHHDFDNNMGYHGEGPDIWSNKHDNLTMATWNTRSLSFERFLYCQNLGFDILAVTELWRSARKFTNDTVSFTCSKPRLNAITGDPVYPDDRAAGVGILLSERAKQKYMRHGSPCERIACVRLKGPVTNLFVIAVYMSHRVRINPCQAETMSSE